MTSPATLVSPCLIEAPEYSLRTSIEPMAMWIVWPGVSSGSGATMSSPLRVKPTRRLGDSAALAGSSSASSCATSRPSRCSAPNLTETAPPLSVPVASSEARSSASIRPASTWLAVRPVRWIFEPSLPRMSIAGMAILSALSFCASARSSSAGVSGVSSLTTSSLLRLVLVNST